MATKPKKTAKKTTKPAAKKSPARKRVQRKPLADVVTAAAPEQQDAATEAPRNNIGNAEIRAIIQTEHFKIDPAVIDSIYSLITQAHELAEQHSVPMIAFYNTENNDDELKFGGAQSFRTQARIPKAFAIAAMLVRSPFITNDDYDTIMDLVESVIEKRKAELMANNLLGDLLRALGLT